VNLTEVKVQALRDQLAAATARAEAAERDASDVRRWADAVPVEALLNYFDHMWACTYPGAFRDMKAIATWVDAKRQEVQP